MTPAGASRGARRRSRSKLYWAVKLLCACPYFGVQSATFLVILLAIDRRDTFQLVEFLLSFKQFQFWVNGLFALVGAAAQVLAGVPPPFGGVEPTGKAPRSSTGASRSPCPTTRRRAAANRPGRCARPARARVIVG